MLQIAHTPVAWLILMAMVFWIFAISNDDPDRKLVYFNDGKGNFKIGSEFGLPEYPTRNLSIADINNDGFGRISFWQTEVRKEKHSIIFA